MFLQGDSTKDLIRGQGYSDERSIMIQNAILGIGTKDKKMLGSGVYDLYGISNHSGGLQGGHYTSFVKMANDSWYHFNDTQVTKLTSNIEHSLISPRAYCLFYQKKNVI